MASTHPISKYLAVKDATVAAFAERVGISRTSLHRIISGSQTPSPQTAWRIVEASEGEITFQALFEKQPA